MSPVNLRLSKIRQRFERNGLRDPIIAVRDQLARLDELIQPRARIAIGVGSRGIDNLPSIVRETVAYVKGRGAQPFIVPAMGSHGGATAEGQVEVLASYGVTEQTVHAPVRATMEVVELKNHPWFLGVQCHPEFQSKPNKAHPLFAAFIAAAIRNQRKK